MKRLFCVVGVLVLLAAAAGADEGVTPLTQEFIKAFEANDLEGVVATYAPDAGLYPSDAMVVVGTDAIRKTWGGLFEAFTVKELKVLDGGHEVHGDLAYGWGRFAMTLVPKAGGDAMTMEGRFTDISKRVAGKWLYTVDHVSVPLPPPPEPAN
jgi:ketosteroid isomerase-like protein